MARLTGPAAETLELTLLSYQFPWLDEDNWLIVRLAVTDGERQWSATDPAFEVSDLWRLAEWLRKVADSDPDARPYWGATEPNLSFEVTGCGEATRLRALFAQAFHPSYRE